ncbi:Heavy-metal-associated domain (N-terminus) and membrane-bounded cytochrome biogenesis cycZ-like domain, possible membrane copper tolerance protein [hydrothermal vent metagenome]|uniref:Heavy-metal-associated domain (N-terminus) and membrane-bounded cytochrome biogenesis cycZ-like domain, possible membrane copper tolerance protein n=1 Tax=hydrothermal vent metagenome TaxID=652676 RepID=A0A3B1A568_9ZZZZ
MLGDELTYLSAFIIGILSGVHCLGMCGGIVSAFSLGGGPAKSKTKKFQIQLSYNLGRIASYTLAGFIVGGLGAITTQQFVSHTLHQYLQTFSALILILMGLYLANWWRILTRLEQLGGIVWNRIEPLTRKLIPIKGNGQAILVGLVWGWLPCGLVYSMLTMSLSTASAQHGALIMLSFGLGTLPNLIAFGLMASSIQFFVKKPVVRTIAGLLIIVFALYLLVDSWWLVGSGNAHQH